MSQGDSQEPIEPQAEQPEERRKRSSVWPWIVLAIVVLIVILLLWWYWRQPADSTVTVIKKTTEIAIDVPEPRPEPVVPAPGDGSDETSSTRLVPDVLGNTQSRATDRLESAGYAVSTSRVYAASRASGYVVGQSPSGGEPLEEGRTVAITVSMGTPSVGTTKVPNIVGLSQAQAESKVKAAGLKSWITYGRVFPTPEGHVISQWPEGGATVDDGSEVLVQIQYNGGPPLP